MESGRLPEAGMRVLSPISTVHYNYIGIRIHIRLHYIFNVGTSFNYCLH